MILEVCKENCMNMKYFLFLQTEFWLYVCVHSKYEMVSYDTLGLQLFS